METEPAAPLRAPRAWERDIPPSMARRPRDHRGFPIPWFVQQDPVDFRVIRPNALAIAHNKRLCWVCGEPRYEKRLCFVVGPMCVVNRVSAELPVHPACARFSAIACPFLSNPRMRRNEKDLPEDTEEPGGIMIARNPGVAAVVHAKTYRPQETPTGVIFRMEGIERVDWWAHGRQATRAEVMASMESGLPLLERMAREDGEDAVAELEVWKRDAMRLLPAEAA
jgi:hypothetical protein